APLGLGSPPTVAVPRSSAFAGGGTGTATSQSRGRRREACTSWDQSVQFRSPQETLVEALLSRPVEASLQDHQTPGLVLRGTSRGRGRTLPPYIRRLMPC